MHPGSKALDPRAWIQGFGPRALDPGPQIFKKVARLEAGLSHRLRNCDGLDGKKKFLNQHRDCNYPVYFQRRGAIIFPAVNFVEKQMEAASVPRRSKRAIKQVPTKILHCSLSRALNYPVCKPPVFVFSDVLPSAGGPSLNQNVRNAVNNP